MPRSDQMSQHPAIQSLLDYGEEGERLLRNVICDWLGEEIEKTPQVFGKLDFLGKTTSSDLKRRTPTWHYTNSQIRQDGWLIPWCKVLDGFDHQHRGKRVYFFYFWSSDKTLWVYELPRGSWSLPPFTPEGHFDNQLHVGIPEAKWTHIWTAPSHVVFEEDTCWIE